MKRSLEDIYLDLAVQISKRSECKYAQHGCVITDSRLERVYSVGYNGGPRGQDNCLCSERGNYGCVHAEQNAMIKVPVIDEEKVIFLTGWPCRLCASMIVNSGASKVVMVDNKYRDDTGLKILERAGIDTTRKDATER